VKAALALALVLLAGASFTSQAQEAAGPIGPGNVLQLLTGLGLVLLLVLGTAWVLRRFGRMPGLTNQAIKTIGATVVGTRERVVLLEVSGTWILIGVAPGQVRPLATLPKGELLTESTEPQPPLVFGALLKRFSDVRHGT
jgi:flagellar protein FliO/FliZ